MERDKLTILLYMFAMLPFISCLEQMCITDAPAEVKFTTSESLRSAYLGDVFSSLFGYTIPKSIKWSGLAPVNPLLKPEALVVLEIPGLGALDMQLDGTCFPLENEGDVDMAYEVLSQRTKQRFYDRKPVSLKIPTGEQLHLTRAEHPGLFKSLAADPKERLKGVANDPELQLLITEGTFNMSEDSDKRFLTELVTVRRALQQLSDYKKNLKDGVPDVFWFQLKSLTGLVQTHGKDSFTVSEAQRMLKQIINEVGNAFQKTYGGEAVISVMMLDDDPSLYLRHSRTLLAAAEVADDNPARQLNLAPLWSPDFPVTFSIIVFLVISLSVSLLGISVAMWNMDPGRDSIIYRMTSQRMKKD